MGRWLVIGVAWAAGVASVACAGCGRVGFDTRPGDHDTDEGGHGDASAPGSCAGFDLCDRFETDQLAAVWTVAGTAVHDTTQAHRGSGSVHFTLPAVSPQNDAGSFLTETATLAGASTESTELWVRAWVRIGALPQAGNNLELLSLDQQGPPRFGDFVFVKSGETDVYSQFDDTVVAIPAAMPTNRWVCLIWHVVRNTNSGMLQLGGDLGSASLAATTDGVPAVSALALGPNFSKTNLTVAQPALEVWIDDVIVHHAALTCTD